MLTEYNVLKPDIPRPGDSLQRELQELYRKQRQAEEKAKPAWLPENIRFRHDPFWYLRLMSIECARTRGHWVWEVVFNLFVLAMAAFALGSVLPFFQTARIAGW